MRAAIILLVLCFSVPALAQSAIQHADGSVTDIMAGDDGTVATQLRDAQYPGAEVVDVAGPVPTGEYLQCVTSDPCVLGPHAELIAEAEAEAEAEALIEATLRDMAEEQIKESEPGFVAPRRIP